MLPTTRAPAGTGIANCAGMSPTWRSAGWYSEMIRRASSSASTRRGYAPVRGSGLPDLAQEGFDVLDELLRPEPVQEMAAAGESPDLDVRQLLQLPLRRVVDRAAQTRLTGEDERRCADRRERVGDQGRSGRIVRVRPGIDERGIDVAEVGHHALGGVEAAKLPIGALAAWSGGGQRLLRGRLGERGRIAARERLPQRRVPRRLPRLRKSQSGLLDHEAPHQRLPFCPGVDAP